MTISEDVTVESQQGDETLEWVLVEDLHDDPVNLRSEYTDIEDLAESIKKVGLLQNIVVRRDNLGRYIIMMGHRRKRGLLAAGIERTRVIVREKEMLEDAVIATMMVENNHRVHLDPIDEARGLHRLKHLRAITNEQELGSLVGRSGDWASGRLRLLLLSAEDQERVRDGSLSISAGIELARDNAGISRSGAKGKKGPTWLGAHHDLARRVMERCKRNKHNTKGPNRVGGVGCGNCWEAVIRISERERMLQEAVETGECRTCGATVDKEPTQTIRERMDEIRFQQMNKHQNGSEQTPDDNEESK
jgi:ParB family chromosome partitioning protein